MVLFPKWPAPICGFIGRPEPALAQGPKQKASEWSCHSCPYPRGSNWRWELGSRRWWDARCAASATHQDGWYTPNIFNNLKIGWLEWDTDAKKSSFRNRMLEVILQLETNISHLFGILCFGHLISWYLLMADLAPGDCLPKTSPGAVVLCKGRYYEALVWELSWSEEMEGWGATAAPWYVVSEATLNTCMPTSPHGPQSPRVLRGMVRQTGDVPETLYHDPYDLPIPLPRSAIYNRFYGVQPPPFSTGFGFCNHQPLSRRRCLWPIAYILGDSQRAKAGHKGFFKNPVQTYL